MVSLPSRPLVGGPLSIDLANTIWGTPGHRVDWLDGDDAVRDLSEEHRHPIAKAEVDATRTNLIEARELVTRLFETSPQHPVSDALAAEINDALADASVIVTNSVDGPIATISNTDSTRAVAVEALIGAIELLRTRMGRVRSCDHEQCTLWFVDTSKAGRRRWCSMERCGNRAKAKRHLDRARATGAPAPT